MEKPANTTTEIHPVIKKRWSPRSFNENPVDQATLEKLFESARWAPSSFNEQPWRFIVGLKGDETFEKIVDCLDKFNQNWARHAAVLAITVVKKTFSKNQKPNRVHKFDLGQSVAYITFQAYDLGLVMHQMAGLSLDKARLRFNIPQDYDPLTAFALGYQGPAARLPEDLRQSELAERSRRPLDELVFKNQFGNSFF
jgi:nitroreductase